MKILITCFKLNEYSGVELFMLDLARELKNKGHEVFVYSFILGEIAEKIKSLGIAVTSNIFDFENQKFDIIHAQHSITGIVVRNVFPEVPLILMIHGVIPDLEQPFEVNFGIDHYITASENSKNYIFEKYKIEKENVDVIGNFIDTNKFCSRVFLSKEPKNLLILSNHYKDEIRDVIEPVCVKLGIKFFHIGLPDNPKKNIEEYMNKSDVVVAIGRGALEAMSCERNVILYDIFGGDGFVDENNFYKLKAMNFSGLLYKKQYNHEEFEKELKKYNPNLGLKLRELVQKEYSREKTIEKFEQIYQETIVKKNDRDFPRIDQKILKNIGKSKNFQENNIDQLVDSDYFWNEIEKYGPTDHLREEIDNLITKHIWKKGFFVSEFFGRGMSPGRLVKMGIRFYQKHGFPIFLSRIGYFLKKYGRKFF